MRSINIISASALFLLTACGSIGEDALSSADATDSDIDGDALGESSTDLRKADSADKASRVESKGAAPAAETAASTGTLTAETAADVVPPQVIGSWVSPSCGARTYARKIQFKSDGSFAAQDLISPCPARAVCTWSGIVNNKGAYTLKTDAIIFEFSRSETGPGAQPFPTLLGIDRDTSAPVEFPFVDDDAARGDARCVYELDGGTAPKVETK